MPDFSNCQGCESQAHIICDCKDDQKIPEVEVLYVLDQRSRKYGYKGKFQLGGRDKKEIEKMVEQELEELEKVVKKKKKEEAIEKAKEKEKKRLESEKMLINTELSSAFVDIDPENNLLEDDEDFNPAQTTQSQNRQDLRNLSMICDRYGVSSRAGAAIANAALADAGVISAADQANVIDKNKLRRAIDRYREERKVADHESLIEAQGEAYYFDCKKDSTLFVGKDEKGKQFN